MKFEWETLDDCTQRAKVFNGWIIRSFAGDREECMVFVPDPNHEWMKVNEEEEKILDLLVDDLDITMRTANVLRVEKIHTVRDLIKKSKSYLLLCPNFGRKSLKEVESKLLEYNLKLRGF